MNINAKANGQAGGKKDAPSGFQIINETDSIMHGTGDYGGFKRSRDEAGLDNATDSDTDTFSPSLNDNTSVSHTNPKPGKKTRGRVKIDMKYIENKLRRYTTFSKRKTGIMKKAYELSTLTGTQVMLLVASETGHVYTFATRKLQPMITSDTGKGLIQTCLNSPDLGQSSPGNITTGDQRMNPSGFEETEITYGQDSENSNQEISSRIHMLNEVNPIDVKQEYAAKSVQPTPGLLIINQPNEKNGNVAAAAQKIADESNNSSALAVVLPSTSQDAQQNFASVQSAANSSNNSNMTIQMSASGLMIQAGNSNVLPTVSLNQLVNTQADQGTSDVSQHSLQQIQFANSSANQATAVQDLSGVQQQQLANALSSSTSQPLMTNLQTPQKITLMPETTQSALVYPTPGMVYATPHRVNQNLPDGSVFGFPQASSLSLQQAPGLSSQNGDMTVEQRVTGTPQYITIPVPVSLANAAQTQMFSIQVPQQAQIPEAKKS